MFDGKFRVAPIRKRGPRDFGRPGPSETMTPTGGRHFDPSVDTASSSRGPGFRRKSNRSRTRSTTVVTSLIFGRVRRLTGSVAEREFYFTVKRTVSPLSSDRERLDLWPRSLVKTPRIGRLFFRCERFPSFVSCSAGQISGKNSTHRTVSRTSAGGEGDG